MSATPGPWKAHERPEGWYVSVGDDHRALVFRANDAALIAAAPALLEACRAVRMFCTSDEDGCGLCFGEPHMPDCPVAVIDAAIAQAEGRS